jgi:DNA-binding MarR family transcriptional regulator
MVFALFTLMGGIQRATRRSKQASALDLLQIVAELERARPSEIAERQQVHPSLVTRQLRELEDLGYVLVSEDPADRRAWLVTLTRAGAAETRRLQQVGIDQFAKFVADWEPEEVQTLTALLEKLERSKAAVAERARRRARRRSRDVAEQPDPSRTAAQVVARRPRSRARAEDSRAIERLT